jgi:hypothetical protein
MSTNEITLPVPVALQKLILANNALLKTYQSKLLSEISEANEQMMGILQLNPEAGWNLDMDRMVYTRPNDVEDKETTNASVS